MATKLGVASARHFSALKVPYWIDNIQLAAAAAESWTVPANVGYIVVIAHAGGVWANAQAAAVVPVADIIDGSAPVFLPQNVPVEFVVDSGDAISFIRDAAVTTNVNIWCYSMRHS